MVFIILSIILASLFMIHPAYATYDPLSVPNNKFGIHIIQATPDESSPSAQLVNSSGGDWGYITFLIESKDRNQQKWQEFFNDLRRRHLIPIVRLATQPEGDFWKRPYDGEEQAWADFLDNLNWPTKNRYVVIYNEPNHAREWGNSVDAKLYAETLDKTITALKNKNRDFFVLNAGLDASAPFQPPSYLDEYTFLQQMAQAVPGIFDKLDGWVSHSYPNPGFIGSPNAQGRGTIRTWQWELQVLSELGISEKLPIFITETGWKHAEGLTYDPSLPKADIISDYFRIAFESAWSDGQIVAVTPFLLNYQELPFDHFSFKKATGEKQINPLLNILGVAYPDYYPFYQTIAKLSKASGKPVQENKAQLVKGEIYSSLVAGETYDISLVFKNTGQSIWNDGNPLKLVPLQGGQQLRMQTLELPAGVKIEPGQEYAFNFRVKTPEQGNFKVTLNLFSGEKQFDSTPLEFSGEVKSPVILMIKSSLKWKKDLAGDYILKISGVNGESSKTITLKNGGVSDEIEVRGLLPDYPFNFTLSYPYYYPATIKKTVHAGLNVLDFGALQPDFISAILYPKEFWKLLPFSN